jgi:hypothetical protein
MDRGNNSSARTAFQPWSQNALGYASGGGHVRRWGERMANRPSASPVRSGTFVRLSWKIGAIVHTTSCRLKAFGWQALAVSGTAYAFVPLASVEDLLPLELQAGLARSDLLRSIKTYLADNQLPIEGVNAPETDPLGE